MLRAFDAFEHHAKANPDQLFADDGETVLTFAEAHRRSRRLVAAYEREGIKPGERIAILSRNCVEQLLLIVASGKQGVVPVPLNVRLTPEDWAWAVADSQSRIVFGESAMIDKLSGELEKIGYSATLLKFDAPQSDLASYHKWLAESHEESEPVDVSGSDHFLQVYTSGTTGRPKGVVLSHANSTAQTASFAAGCGQNIAAGHRCLQNLPLFHIGGIFVCLYVLFFGGGVILRRDFNPQTQLDILGSGSIDSSAMVPTMIAAVLEANETTQLDIPTLQFLAYGASPISPTLLQQAHETLRCDLVQIFGMTESHSMITILDAQSHRRGLSGEKPSLLGSCGRAAPGTEVRIVDTEGNQLSNNERGELICRGPQVMLEYWRRPEASAETLVDGWLHTGDAATRDDEGYYYIVDRIKDLIVSGGENIAPGEIEQVISKIDGVAEVAVIGVPDKAWGEAVAAIVVGKPGANLSEESIVSEARTKLASFKVPKLVTFLDALPRNAAGKVLRTELRKPYWSEQGRQVS